MPDLLHTVAQWLFHANRFLDEGMARIRSGVARFERAGCIAQARGAKPCSCGYARSLCASSEVEEDRKAEFADRFSRLERHAAQGGYPGNAAKSGLDGRGVRTFPEVHKEEYRRDCRPRWSRKLSL